MHLFNTLRNDLALIRIIEPASKLRSITLLKTYFGIQHRRQRYYESTNQINKKKITMRVPVPIELQKIIAKLSLPH